MALREPVGKRVFCSNRYRHAGCGRTVQLYVACVLPQLQYGAAHVFVFLSLLFTGMAVEAAYRSVSGRPEPRHAWRWLHRLTHKLVDFRACLPTPTAAENRQALAKRFDARVRRLRLLLPSLAQLFAHFQTCPCAGYQLDRQSAFI